MRDEFNDPIGLGLRSQSMRLCRSVTTHPIIYAFPNFVKSKRSCLGKNAGWASRRISILLSDAGEPSVVH